MNQNFSVIMNNAINRCNCLKVEDGMLQSIYPFTTENISGYIDNFNLKDKSLLTVGSSGNQVINAILKGCKDITLLDINPYTKFYYYLKVASIITLNLDEFMRFLRYKDYPEVFVDNKEVFNIESWNKIKIVLRLIDYESYLFWDELFQTINPVKIRKRLFSLDEYNSNIISYCNSYLKSQYIYEETRGKVKNICPTFINGDIFNIDLKREYDNIWLSNIGTTITKEEMIRIMVDNLDKYLNDNATLLISYLYDTNKNTKYKDDWSIIYNLDKTFELLKDYQPYLGTFTGINDFKFNSNNMNDSILVYQKH